MIAAKNQIINAIGSKGSKNHQDASAKDKEIIAEGANCPLHGGSYKEVEKQSDDRKDAKALWWYQNP